MKYSTILLIFAILSAQMNCQRPMKPGEDLSKYNVRFRGIECLNNYNLTAYFTFCYVKSYSRIITTMNFGLKVERKVKSIYIQLVASFRYGNIYREIVDTKQLNWCQIMDGADYNLFLKLVLDMLRPSVPGLFHKCPYEGLMEFRNITLDTETGKKVTLFPEGQYKFNVTIWDKPERLVLAIVAFTEIKSPIKSSFG
ncbi:hypothetical protein ACKWTF_015523 [Chironomus riparius]